MVIDPEGAILYGKFIVNAMTIGVRASQIWNEYQADLLARQQQRLADGTQLTMTDVQELLAQTKIKLDANHQKLQEMADAQAASMVGGLAAGT